MANGFGDGLDGLNACGTGADHPNPLVRQINRVMRPTGGVKGGALEIINTIDTRQGMRR